LFFYDIAAIPATKSRKNDFPVTIAGVDHLLQIGLTPAVTLDAIKTERIFLTMKFYKSCESWHLDSRNKIVSRSEVGHAGANHAPDQQDHHA
jgi:hypothetical protein